MRLKALTYSASIIFALSCGTSRAALVQTFDYTGSFQSFTVMNTGIYDIAAFGGKGGDGHVDFTQNVGSGGAGAEIGGDFLLTKGEVLSIAVGGAGGHGVYNAAGGGGGGSFVVLGGAISNPLVIAGGGGGGGIFVSNGGPGQAGTAGGNGINMASPSGQAGGAGGTTGQGGEGSVGPFAGGGGGGFLASGSDGTGFASGQGGASFTAGLGGGAGNIDFVDMGGAGGFGGGGGAGSNGGGGGGGYSGGGGAGGNSISGGGGGGGSYLSDLVLPGSDFQLAGGNSEANGYVTFSFVSPSTVPLPASAPMFGAALIALGAVGYGLKRKGKAAA